MRYVKQDTFEALCLNQNKLIEILNHRMTSLENSVSIMQKDVQWVKRIGIFLTGIISALTVGVLTKILIGG